MRNGKFDQNTLNIWQHGAVKKSRVSQGLGCINISLLNCDVLGRLPFWAFDSLYKVKIITLSEFMKVRQRVWYEYWHMLNKWLLSLWYISLQLCPLVMCHDCGYIFDESRNFNFHSTWMNRHKEIFSLVGIFPVPEYMTL